LISQLAYEKYGLSAAKSDFLDADGLTYLWPASQLIFGLTRKSVLHAHNAESDALPAHVTRP